MAALAGGLQAQFELIATYTHDSHWWRYLLQCRGCGQLYFYEFHEEIDWAGGNDPQYSTWIPVASAEMAQDLVALGPRQFGGHVPRLCKDWPADRPSPELCWKR